MTSIELPHVFGPYVLERFIAAGGMAEVFLATRKDGAIPGRICVKRMLPEMMKSAAYVTMFRDETALSMRLVHPNIVRVLECGEHEGSMYMAMEFVDGMPTDPSSTSAGSLVRASVITGWTRRTCPYFATTSRRCRPRCRARRLTGSTKRHCQIPGCSPRASRSFSPASPPSGKTRADLDAHVTVGATARC